MVSKSQCYCCSMSRSGTTLGGPCTVPFHGTTWKDHAWSYSAEDHSLDLLFSGFAFDRWWVIIDDHKRERKEELEGAFSYVWRTGFPSPSALTAMSRDSAACTCAGLGPFWLEGSVHSFHMLKGMARRTKPWRMKVVTFDSFRGKGAVGSRAGWQQQEKGKKKKGWNALFPQVIWSEPQEHRVLDVTPGFDRVFLAFLEETA